MRVDILKESGFCGGVTKALWRLDKTIKENPNRDIYLLGEIVHNKQVNDKYKNLGVKVISIDDLKNIKDNEIVVTGAHGCSQKLKDSLKRFTHIDTSCPFVRMNQMMIIDSISKNKNVVFIGKKDHSETIALTEDFSDILVVERVDDLTNFESLDEGIVYNQTTFNMSKLEYLEEQIKKRAPYFTIKNTMCETTKKIQGSLNEINPKYNVLLVVGDENSNNARSIKELSKYHKTFMISSSSMVKDVPFTKYDSVLIIGSASTPKTELVNVKEKVKEKLESLSTYSDLDNI